MRERETQIHRENMTEKRGRDRQTGRGGEKTKCMRGERDGRELWHKSCSESLAGRQQVF